MPIGEATRDIAPGEFVHTHNLKTRLAGELEYSYNPVPPARLPATEAGRTFLGFRRADGTVGVRNDLWIIPTVGCVNKLAENLARDFERQLPQGWLFFICTISPTEKSIRYASFIKWTTCWGKGISMPSATRRFWMASRRS